MLKPTPLVAPVTPPRRVSVIRSVDACQGWATAGEYGVLPRFQFGGQEFDEETQLGFFVSVR